MRLIEVVAFRYFIVEQRHVPVQGFVIPTLQRCGLLSERVAGHFHEFLRANLGGDMVGENVEQFVAMIPALPADTAAWVLGEVSQ